MTLALLEESSPGTPTTPTLQRGVYFLENIKAITFEVPQLRTAAVEGSIPGQHLLLDPALGQFNDVLNSYGDSDSPVLFYSCLGCEILAPFATTPIPNVLTEIKQTEFAPSVKLAFRQDVKYSNGRPKEIA